MQIFSLTRVETSYMKPKEVLNNYECDPKEEGRGKDQIKDGYM